jgi:hypothetical protein
VKITPSADYYVGVKLKEWEVESFAKPLYAGIIDVLLHYAVSITFIPDLSTVAPPWDAPFDPPPLDERTPPEEVRLYEALTAIYGVTPNDPRAGTEERFVWPPDGDPRFDTSTIFFVTAAQFTRYSDDLVQLSEIATGLRSFTRLSALPDFDVLHFLEHRILASAWLNPRHAHSLCRSQARRA